MDETVIATQHKHITVIKEVLEAESLAISNLKNSINHHVATVIEVLLSCKGRIIVTGIGKSGIIGRKITSTLSSTGTPSLFLHPAEGLHGDLGMVTRNDIVLALSNSGESEEIINLIPSIKVIGAKIIAFVGNEQSTLAKKADNIICIGKVREACPLELAPTTSTTLMLSMGDAIAIALLKARGFSAEDFALYHPGGSIGKKLLVKVKTIIEITKKNPVFLFTSTIKDVLFDMTKSGLGATSIVDENGHLVGVITDGDIRRALANGHDILNTSISSLFNPRPISILEDTLAYEALSKMQNYKVNVLPVVNEQNQPTGMIHIHDLTKLGF